MSRSIRRVLFPPGAEWRLLPRPHRRPAELRWQSLDNGDGLRLFCGLLRTDSPLSKRPPPAHEHHLNLRSDQLRLTLVWTLEEVVTGRAVLGAS